MVNWWVAVVYICLAFFIGMYVMWTLIESGSNEIPPNIRLTIDSQFIGRHRFFKFKAINEDTGESVSGSYIKTERRARKLANRAIDRLISRRI